MILAISVSTITWFVLAAILFFNPIVDKVYQSQENHPSVNALPKNPTTIGKILFAVFIQCLLWAIVFVLIKPVLPPTLIEKAIYFGSIILVMKMIPRDIDRILLTTYPMKRMAIEFVIGGICAYAVGFVFAYFL